jgi:6-pyruvoyltetrahydropterin/6-carboxytetrahydropterin synthase
MRTRVVKKFKFEMAHILDNSYSKECQNIHGHSYVLEVEFTGSLNIDGMIIDFKRMKEIISPLVDRMDHSLMVSTATAKSNVFVEIQKLGMNLFIFHTNPTAENMCHYIFDYIRQQIHLISRVRLWETENSYAEVSYE